MTCQVWVLTLLLLENEYFVQEPPKTFPTVDEPSKSQDPMMRC